MIAMLRVRLNGLLRANESEHSRVAIDGNCTRKKAERMMVREYKWAYSIWNKVNLGGTAVRIYRPEEWVILLFGIFVYKGVFYESKSNI